MTGLQQKYINEYKRKKGEWRLVNKKLKIRDEMKNIEMSHFKDVYPISLELDWMSVGGRIPKNDQNLNLVNKFSVGDGVGDKQNFINIRALNDKDLGKIMIKEVRSDILPIVSQFFEFSSFNSFLLRSRESS